MSDTVFILGAGASRHANVPLMREFFQVIEDLHRTEFRPDPDFDLVIRGRHQLSTVHSKAQFDLRNLESVFAAFEMGALFRSLGELPPQDVARLVDSMQRVIVKTIETRMRVAVENRALQPPHEYWLFASLISMLLDFNKRVSIITFNYDVGLDFALRERGIRLDYCTNDSPDLFGTERSIELMKLHGSINWTTCRNCHSVVVEQVHDAVNHEELKIDLAWSRGGTPQPVERAPVRFSSRFADLIHCDGRNCNTQPLIVPPTSSKAGHREAVAAVWRRAAGKLAAAENIFVIGYSWPNSDQFFRELYALGTAGKTILRQFWVINPDRNVWERFQNELLGPQAREVMNSASDFNSGMQMVAGVFGWSWESIVAPIRNPRRAGKWGS